jgi:hypothetical protein
MRLSRRFGQVTSSQVKSSQVNEDKVGVSTAAREAEGDDEDDRRLAADVASVS